VRSAVKDDEELASVGTGTFVSHAHDAARTMS
jgi:hypothetical protein